MFNELRRYGFVFMALVLSSLIGCGGGEKESEQTAGKDSETKAISERIIGNWQGNAQIDDAALESYMKENNAPEDQKEMVKKSITEDKFLLSFQKDGTSKVGNEFNGRIGYQDLKWKVENETGNKALIAMDDPESDDDGKLDVTFQDDGSIVAKIVPPEKAKGSMPDMTIHFKKVDELPKETDPRPIGKTMPVKTPGIPAERAPE